ALGEVGEQVGLLVHTVVREDAFDLYGFVSEIERRMFELLISVSRIGPRLARNILSGIEAERLNQLLQQENAAMISSAPGVGTKTAERMIVELRGKLPKVQSEELDSSDLNQDVISALLNLGYRRKEAEAAAARVSENLDPDDGIEQLLRSALKLLSKA
ncbi:MAG: Holliday junction branch migration protein RuvA, partial [Candidatus Alcyoniella australis]|nr:Holliday junction branch migration protein RuvA [Candidatus Alcyoniella australis]